MIVSIPFTGYAKNNEKPRFLNWSDKPVSRFIANEVVEAEMGQTKKAVDPEGDRLYFKVLRAPDFVSVDESTGTVMIYPKEKDVGREEYISIWVSDRPDFNFLRTSFLDGCLIVAESGEPDWWEETDGHITMPDQGKLTVWAGSMKVGLEKNNLCSEKILSSAPFYADGELYLPLKSVGGILGWKFRLESFTSNLIISYDGMTVTLPSRGEKKIILRNKYKEVEDNYGYTGYTSSLKPIMVGGEIFMPQGFFELLRLAVRDLQEPEGGIGYLPAEVEKIICDENAVRCFSDQFGVMTFDEMKAGLMGEPISGRSLAVSVAGDMIVVGDIRDCVLQSYYFFTKDSKGDPLIFSFAAGGILSTFVAETGADSLVSGAKNYFKVVKSLERADPIFAKAMKEAFQQKVKPKGSDLKSAKKLIDFFTKNILDIKKRASYMPIIRSSADVGRVMA